MTLSAAAQRFLAGPILSEIDDDARLALSRSLREHEATEGTILIAEGKPNDRLWFLIEGSATVVRRGQDGDRPIARLDAPGIFGATTFFRPTPATVSIRAASAVALLTLDHASHNQLRLESPRAAEALALATVRVLAERFDLIDQRVHEYIAAYSPDHPRSTEWSAFRARLFEEPNII